MDRPEGTSRRRAGRALRSTESLIVADYRGLTNAELRVCAPSCAAAARSSGRQEHAHAPCGGGGGCGGAARTARGADGDRVRRDRGDPIAVAKALADTAKETKVMSLRGGHPLRPLDHGRRTSRSSPSSRPRRSSRASSSASSSRRSRSSSGCCRAPLRDLVGLIDARIAQLEEAGDTSAAAALPEERGREAGRRGAGEATADAETERAGRRGADRRGDR